MNKRAAIMINVLVAVIAAIILVLLPAGWIYEKVAGAVSTQATDNFYEFGQFIVDYTDTSPNDLPDDFVLIMDKETMIVLYPWSLSELEGKYVTVDLLYPKTVKPNTFYGPIKATVDLPYPQESCKGEPCLVLCVDYEIEDEGSNPLVRCGEIKKPVVLEGIEVVGIWSVIREEDDPRRIPVIVEDTNKGLVIHGGSSTPVSG